MVSDDLDMELTRKRLVRQQLIDPANSGGSRAGHTLNINVIVKGGGSGVAETGSAVTEWSKRDRRLQSALLSPAPCRARKR